MPVFNSDDQDAATAVARDVLRTVATQRGTALDDPMTCTYALNALLCAAYELALLHEIEPRVLTDAVKRNYGAIYAHAEHADSAVH